MQTSNLWQAPGALVLPGAVTAYPARGWYFLAKCGRCRMLSVCYLREGEDKLGDGGRDTLEHKEAGARWLGEIL